VFPHWKKGDTHSVVMKTTLDETTNGVAKNYRSALNAKFVVTEKDTSGYIVEWTYTKALLAANEIDLENNILAGLLNTKLLIKFSLTGRFITLVNVDEVKTATDKVIDELIAGSAANPSMNVQYKGAKQLVSTKQGLEIALLKQIKFYNFSFGYNYKLNSPQVNHLKFPNPMGGQSFDAIENVKLTKLDNANKICVIETSKMVDGTVLKNEIIGYLKKVSKKDSNAIEEDLRKEPLAYNESSMQQIDFSKGIIQKSSYTRNMNFGFQKRILVLEIETAD
jgi:hypothetical protein